MLKEALLSLIYVASRVYFLLITLVFNAVNYFKERKRVPAPTDPLLLISAGEAVRRIAKREITSQQLVGAYIHRIDQVNDIINAAVVKLFSEARAKAKEIDQSIADLNDEELQELVKAKPLLGVPYTCKDAIEVEGQVVTCGIYSQQGVKCTSSAEVIKRMNAAGAILIALTNVPEVCMWVESQNGIYGRTKNPYDTRRSVGGSSGGEGALISAAGSLIGVGSDIGGSIRIPSFSNGVFGMKNTPGVVPLEGHIPESVGFQKQMLQIGPICRYVEDIPLVAEVMGGENASPLRLADAADLKKTRVFYMEGIKGLSTVMSLGCEMKSALLKAVEHLEGEFDIEAIRIDLPLFSKAVEMETASLSVKGVPRHGEYLLSLKGDKGCINWVTEIPKLLTGNSVHTAGGLFFAAFDSLDRTTEEEKTKTIKLRERLSRQLNELLGDDGILLFPSWPHTAPFHNQPVFAPFNLAYTCIFNVLTLPTIQCPMGVDSNGVPLGIQVVASHNCDRLLIAAAKEISEAFGGWTPPWEH